MSRKRTCRSCRGQVSYNAIVRSTGLCLGCYNAANRARRIERMPDELKALHALNVEGGPLTDWESQFVGGLVQRFENGNIQHLSAGQADKAAEIYAKRWVE